MYDQSDRVTLSIAEATRILGIGKSSLYQEIHAGRLRSFKLGTRRLIPMAAIRDWMTNRQAGS